MKFFLFLAILLYTDHAQYWTCVQNCRPNAKVWSKIPFSDPNDRPQGFDQKWTAAVGEEHGCYCYTKNAPE